MERNANDARSLAARPPSGLEGSSARYVRFVSARPGLSRRWITAASWPIGVALTSWDYMWRSTPMHRSEAAGGRPGLDGLALLPDGISATELQPQEEGYGPLFHRRYQTQIRKPRRAAEALMGEIRRNINKPAPSSFARFQKVVGQDGPLALGDEYLVRMPGPWDGPVRVVDVSPRSFRFATLRGHLEAGQIEFRVADGQDGELCFQIESRARSSSRLTNLLYHHLRMSKEVQAHMWVSFLEGVVRLSGGRMTGGVKIETERFDG